MMMMTFGGVHETAEPESSAVSGTQSEIKSVLRYREKKISINNQAFTTQQWEALRMVGVHVDAISLGLKNIAEVFTESLEVRYFI
jgi:hypothetical protein